MSKTPDAPAEPKSPPKEVRKAERYACRVCHLVAPREIVTADRRCRNERACLRRQRILASRTKKAAP